MKTWMKFKIEKETKWNASKMAIVTRYYIWAGSQCLASVGTEEAAMEAYEVIKSTYIQSDTVVIKEEDIEIK
jgi:hypothetical protein